jgi:hypothetical protein
MELKFELPINAIKGDFLYHILKDSDYISEVDFSMNNPSYTFKLIIPTKGNKKYYNQQNDFLKLKNIILKNIQKLDNNLKNQIKKVNNLIDENNNLDYYDDVPELVYDSEDNSIDKLIESLN